MIFTMHSAKCDFLKRADKVSLQSTWIVENAIAVAFAHPLD